MPKLKYLRPNRSNDDEYRLIAAEATIKAREGHPAYKIELDGVSCPMYKELEELEVTWRLTMENGFSKSVTFARKRAYKSGFPIGIQSDFVDFLAHEIAKLESARLSEE